MYTNTNETFRSEDDKGQISREVYQSRAGGDDALRYIKRDLLHDTLREDACLSCLRDVELQYSISREMLHESRESPNLNLFFPLGAEHRILF